MVILSSKEGAMIELQQPMVPEVQKVGKEQLQYGYVGISELALRVPNVDEWFEKVKAAGYELQTSYVWNAGGIVRSFLFYDPDGNMVQMVEDLPPRAA